MINEKLEVTVDFGCFHVELKAKIQDLSLFGEKFLKYGENPTEYDDDQYWDWDYFIIM